MPICIDLETDLMCEGLAAPPLVCMAVSDGESSEILVPWEGEHPHARFERILRSGELLINQHVFYDLGVLCAERPDFVPLVFEAIEAGRIRCLKVREQLIRIALGQAKFIEEDDGEGDGGEDEEDEGGGVTKTRFDLAAIAERWLGVKLEKDDTWRKSYAILRGIPLRRWPSLARDYVCSDSHHALAVWKQQQRWVDDNFDDGKLPGEVEANCAGWALHLMKVWGVRTCPEAVAKLTEEVAWKSFWYSIGLLMPDPARPDAPTVLRLGGTRAEPKAVETKKVVQARVSAALEAKGLSVPLTPKGQIKTGKKQLDDSGVPILKALGEYKALKKILGTYIPRYVAKGIEVPITADWNPLVESFRISCSKPNLTNPPRAGNVRECIIARPGFVYVSADFDQAELRSSSQVELVLFGDSIMADAFRQDVDPHLILAASLLGITVEEAIRRYAEGDKEVEEARQFAKQGNFGFDGGMGALKFKERSEMSGIPMPIEKSEFLRAEWKKTWNKQRWLNYGSDFDGTTIVHPITGMVRGGCGYSDGLNHHFQHLTAIGVKQALWDLSKECYTDKSSVLYGARPVIDMHDELFGEIREEVAAEGALRWGAVMKCGMEKWVRDVPTKCTPVLTRRLYKGAKQVFIDGKLVPSKPMMVDGKKKWVPDLFDERVETRRAA